MAAKFIGPRLHRLGKRLRVAVVVLVAHRDWANVVPECLDLARKVMRAGSGLEGVKHYRWWLDRELRFVRPKLVVALGATTVLALAGKPLSIAKFRGPADFNGYAGFITVHPSHLLRGPDRTAKKQAYREFVNDLRRIRKTANAQETLR